MDQESFLVRGSVIGRNQRDVYFEFEHPDSRQKEFGIFVMTRLFVKGQKIKGNQVNESLFDELRQGQITAYVRPKQDDSFSTFLAEDGTTRIVAKFHSSHVWKSSDCMPDVVKDKEEVEMDLGNINSTSILHEDGEIVHVSLGGTCFIKMGQAMVKCLAKDLYINGVCASEVGSIQIGSRISFKASKDSTIRPHVFIPGPRCEEVILKPEWSCSLAWMGKEPKQKVNLSKKKQPQNEKLEYYSGQMSRYLDRKSGLIMANKETPILFKMQDLIIQGKSVSESAERLSDLLSVGDKLFCYAKDLIPHKVLGDDLCKKVAVEIWKGKRTSDEELEYKPILKEGQVTTSKMCQVLSVDGNLGKAVILGQEELVLFSKSQLFIHGQKLKHHDMLHEFVKPGSKLFCDMAPCISSQTGCDYFALHSRSEDSSSNLPKLHGNESQESFRAKIVAFDEAVENQGVVSGVLHITTGSKYIGEKVLFSRSELYIFEACMALADLSFILKENDKLYVHLQELTLEEKQQSLCKYGSQISFKAKCAYVGPVPKTENTRNRVANVGIGPFLEKRGMDEDFFNRLVNGEVEPKPRNSNLSLSTLPPSSVTARVIELKRPDKSGAFTSNGIMLLESGKYANEKAFFDRNVVWIFGQHMLNADLMRVIQETDKFSIEVVGGTNNKVIPYKATILARCSSFPENSK